jgi:hypothetical protein
MNIPAKLDVFSHEVKVEWVSAEQHDNSGSYNEYYNTINIHQLTEGLSESAQAETLFHELVECVNSKLDLKLKHYQISSISTGLFDIIRRNNLDFRKEKV